MTEAFPQPGENPLLDAQLKEAADVSTFINSPAWAWLKGRLQTLETTLMAKATATGVKRDDRMIALGSAMLAKGILARPGMLMDLLDRKAKAEMAIPEARGLIQETGLPPRITTGIL